MALAVAEKDELIKMMKERVDARIKAIEGEHVQDVAAIRHTARRRALAELGCAREFAALEKMAAQVKELEARLVEEREALWRQLPGDHDSKYNLEGQIETIVDDATTRIADSLQAKTVWGREIARLLVERDGVKAALLLATTSKQVKELWTRVTSILGDGGRAREIERLGLEIK